MSNRCKDEKMMQINFAFVDWIMIDWRVIKSSESDEMKKKNDGQGNGRRKCIRNGELS